MFKPFVKRETDNYSFTHKVSIICHLVGLLIGLPCLLWLALLIFFWPLQRYLGKFCVIQRFYSFLIHMYSCWFYFTLRWLGVQVIEVGDDTYPLRRESTLLIGDETTPFAITVIEQVLAPYFINGPYLSIVDSPKHMLTFLDKARGFYIFESAKEEDVKELKRYMQNNLPKKTRTDYQKGYIKSELLGNQQKIKVLNAGMLALQSIIKKFGCPSKTHENAPEKLLEWVMHVSLIFHCDMNFSTLLTGKIQDRTKIFIIKKMYPIGQIPIERELLFDWLNVLTENKKNTEECFRKNGYLPEIGGNHTPYPPRPLRTGSFTFASIVALYFYFMYFYVLHPFLTFLFYIG